MPFVPFRVAIGFVVAAGIPGADAVFVFTIMAYDSICRLCGFFSK